MERMLKGIGRSVVVVSDVESDLFEQAIFIVKSSGAAKDGRSPDDLLREACRVAAGCSGSRGGHSRLMRMLRLAAPAAAGGAAVGAAWLLSTLV